MNLSIFLLSVVPKVALVRKHLPINYFAKLIV